ncbi:MAG TPA: hypothetical protein VF069_04235 [Streptosporangiaceae bacterium]
MHHGSELFDLAGVLADAVLHRGQEIPLHFEHFRFELFTDGDENAAFPVDLLAEFLDPIDKGVGLIPAPFCGVELQSPDDKTQRDKEDCHGAPRNQGRTVRVRQRLLCAGMARA